MLYHVRRIASAAAKFITEIGRQRGIAAGARLDARETVPEVGLAIVGRLVQMDQIVAVRMGQQLAQVLIGALELVADGGLLVRT